MKMTQMVRNGKNQYGEPKEKIECKICKEKLRVKKFSFVDKNNSTNGRRNVCKSCSAKKAKVERERRKTNWKYKPTLTMFNNSKQRAKKSGIEHSIQIEDIIIPDICPVLGIPLEVGDRKNHQNAPSIDRINNNMGYKINNIMVMSTRANILKKDATLDELILIGEWAKKIKEQLL